MSKNVYGIKYITINLAIIYKCNSVIACKGGKACTVMDDLLLFMPTKKSHIAKLEESFKTLLKNGHKISPKKCQLF